MRRAPDAAALAAAAATAAALAAGADVPRPALAAAVRTTLAQLAQLFPGRLVEVRVPPFAAVQVGVPGRSQVHTRGTPPNVVETDPSTWLALALGTLPWQDARADHRVQSSGTHADLTDQLAGLAASLPPVAPPGRAASDRA